MVSPDHRAYLIITPGLCLGLIALTPSHPPDCNFPDNFADLEWRQEDVGLYEVKHTFFSMQFLIG